MSLVAYYSSGEDSGGEDSSDSGQAVWPKLLKHQNNQEIESDDLSHIHKQSEQWRDTSMHGRINDSRDELADNIPELKEEKNPRKSIFSFLPPPSQKSEDLKLSEDDDGIIMKQRSGLKKETIRETVNEYGLNGHKKVKKLSLPEPKRTVERERQKVKITIPSLPQGDSDSDEEESKAAKKHTFGKGSSGLLGCLPQPKFSSATNKAVGTKPNERKPSKLYVPYTLNKKKDTSAKSDNKQIDKGADSESDDEGPSDSFFSFGESVKSSKEDLDGPNKAILSSKNSEESKSGTFSITSKGKISKAVSFPAVDGSKKEMNEGVLQNHDRSIDNIKDVSFSALKATGASQMSSSDNKRITVKDVSSEVTGPYELAITGPYGVSNPGLYTQSVDVNLGQISGPHKTYNELYSGKYSGTDPHQAYNESYSGTYTGTNPHKAYNEPYSGTYSGKYAGVYHEDKSAAYSDAYHVTHGSHWSNSSYHQGSAVDQYGHYGQKAYLNPQPDNQHSQINTLTSGNLEQMGSIDADQLRRLQGKRERRVQEIDIIDIHGEQMQCDASMLLKSITEEKTPMPKRSKSDLPSSQQKRKHQITYLAFQAKERENELRKSWAANLQTKRQTQQKYGF